jgi:hypothetical protein
MKNVKLIEDIQISCHWTYANAPKTIMTKQNFTYDTLYHNPIFICLIMVVNLDSSWLPCAQYELEFKLPTMWTM